MSIYIAFHKSFPLLTKDPAYQPIHVGKDLSDKELKFIGDNTGDNISIKNQNYAELTGLYWIWKNTSSDFVGLSHYRRFFFAKKPTLKMQAKKWSEYIIHQGKKRQGVFYSSDINSKELIITGKEIEELLKTYDALIPVKRKLRYNVYEQYKRKHHIEDMDHVKNIIAEKYPDYLNAFNESMSKKEILHCNMFVMKRPLFDDYMRWLFDILFELEKHTDISNYSNYQKRIYGYISERLMDVWIIQNRVNYSELPILYFKKLKGS